MDFIELILTILALLGRASLAIVPCLVLYFIVRIAVRHGMQDFKDRKRFFFE